MTMIMDIFDQKMRENKDYANLNEMTFSTSYSTGILPLDRAISYVQDVNGKLRYEIGFSDGTINTIIGDPGTGKTSLLVAAACNIIRRFRTSCVYFEQAEGGITIQRIKNLSGFSDEEFVKRFKVRDAGITIESIFRRVAMLHDIKVANPNKFLYDTHMIDFNGKPIFKYEPTIMVIDSLKMVQGDARAERDDTNNMDNANNARLLSDYLIRMVPLIREANIILIIVNHITTDINTGFFPKKPEFPYLKQGEHIPCGKQINYLTNLLIRLDINGKLTSDEAYGIDGTIVGIDIGKSRTSKPGRAKCQLVYNMSTGYDSDLSAFHMLKAEKRIEGAGAYLKLPGCDIKFSQRNFKEKLYTEPALWDAFSKLCVDYLTSSLLSEYEEIQAAPTRRNMYDSVLEQLGAIPEANTADDEGYVIPVGKKKRSSSDD